MQGNLILVLHAHLPYVRHPEQERFLEERWFFEAVTETYIPLIKFFDRMQAENIPFKLTLSDYPTLAAMMEDPLLPVRHRRNLDLSIHVAGWGCSPSPPSPDLELRAWTYKR